MRLLESYVQSTLCHNVLASTRIIVHLRLDYAGTELARSKSRVATRRARNANGVFVVVGVLHCISRRTSKITSKSVSQFGFG